MIPSLRAAAALLSLLALGAPARAGGGNTAAKSGPAPTIAPISAPSLPSVNVGAPLIGVGGQSLGLQLPGLRQDPGQPRATASAPEQPGQAAAPGADANLQRPESERAAEPSAEAAREPAPEPTAGAIDSAVEPAAEPQAAASAQLSDAAQSPVQQTNGQAASAESAEGRKAQLDAAFDGSGRKQASVSARLRAASRALGARVLFRSVGTLLPPEVSERVSKASGVPAPKRPESQDQFGGPNGAGPMTLRQRAAYGLKWGMNLLGIASLMQLVLLPVQKAFPWQLHLPDGVLAGLGRVELMIGMGPAEIAQALASNPLAFLLLGVPGQSFLEELSFRGIQFGLLFLALAAIRPVAQLISRAIDRAPYFLGFAKLPDGQSPPHLNLLVQKALRWSEGLSSLAYPAAAIWTSLQFALAHFPSWGADPYTFAVRFALGMGLTFVAYRTRGLFAAGVAHTVFNVVPLALIAAAIFMGSFVLAEIFSLGLMVGSIIFLIYSWRKHARLAKLLSSKGATAAMIALVVTLGSLGALNDRRGEGSAELARRSIVWSAQQKEKDQQPPAPVKPEAAPSAETNPAPAGASGAPGPALGMAKTLTDHSQELADLTAKVKPAVAKIVARTRMGGATGSGFVVRKEGLLVTNAHVVAGVGVGGIVRVEFADGTAVLAKVVAMNTDRDIAFVQLPTTRPDGTPWPTVPVGDTSKVREGHLVLALGHPLGLPFSTSLGVVSGLGDRGSIYVQQLQTDAAVNHGNSGGPLVNMEGEVIAINTAIAAPTAESGSIGIGFSITSEFLNAALKQFDATGDIYSSYMGVIVYAANPTAPATGVLVEQIRPGSAAEKAGVRPGDLILGVNGKMFGHRQGLQELARALAGSNPKTEITLSISRAGRSITLKFPLGTKAA